MARKLTSQMNLLEDLLGQEMVVVSSEPPALPIPPIDEIPDDDGKEESKYQPFRYIA